MECEFCCLDSTEVKLQKKKFKGKTIWACSECVLIESGPKKELTVVPSEVDSCAFCDEGPTFRVFDSSGTQLSESLCDYCVKKWLFINN